MLHTENSRAPDCSSVSRCGLLQGGTTGIGAILVTVIVFIPQPSVAGKIYPAVLVQRLLRCTGVNGNRP